MRQGGSPEVEKKVITILKVLSESSESLGSITIARELRRYGVFLTERAVRYHLKIMDERGYTYSLGRDGRILTPKGMDELAIALAPQQVGFILNKLELLAFYTTFNPETKTGNVPINTSLIDKDQFGDTLAAMADAFKAGICVSDLVAMATEGDKLGSVVIPTGKIGLATVCSVVINGVLLKSGIPVDSRFGGLLEVIDSKPQRFVTAINYNGTSVDPSEQCILSGMTSVQKVVETGSGKLLANFREIIAPSRSAVEEIIASLKKAGIGGVYVLGNTSEVTCKIPVELNKVGMVLLGGLNPVAAAIEQGFKIENASESGTIDYQRLKKFSQLDGVPKQAVMASRRQLGPGYQETTKHEPHKLGSGSPELDELLQGFQDGDNIVWQIDSLSDYTHFAELFADQATREGRECLYFRFALHQAILKPRAGVTIVEIEPSPGFNFFSEKVSSIIEERGSNVYYVFDNLSALVASWATDELLSDFFRVTCPHILEAGAVAYFALTRGQHAHTAIARIRDTTQILIDIYHMQGAMYLHPLKVWGRYSAQMFLPHLISEAGWSPVFQSGEAARISSSMYKQPLSVAVPSIAPWESVYAKLMQFRQARGKLDESDPEIKSLKHELTRMIIGEHRSFNRLASKYFTVDDLIEIRNRIIGTGHIGGKAAGMLLARRILLTEKGEVDYSQVLEPHDSFYIGSDVFFTFLVNNDLFQLGLQVNKDWQISAEEFEKIEQLFLNGEFTPEIVGQFRDMLDYFGQAPIIARSSSLMEDSLGNAFAGKYMSIFCPNQGDPEERLEEFLHAVKLIYASVLNPDAVSYRVKQGLYESDEQMAILVQRVSGTAYKHYFFPPLAGVAFSKNLYRWADRIDPQKGIIRLVFGLGTRAVNRVGGDYPRMIAISHPQLRPEYGARIAKYSQHNMDLLDLKSNMFTSRLVTDVLGDYDYPNLRLIASQMEDGYTHDVTSISPEASATYLLLTFNNLTEKTPFVKIMGDMLTRLEEAYGYPIDSEFTAHVRPDGEVRVNLLQCRSLRLPGTSLSVEIPENIPAERTLFTSKRFISGGMVQNIRYILYIDPVKYAATAPEAKKTLGRVVGRVNKHPSIIEGKIMMMGPGRWGSSNTELGVNVGYADIDNTSVLVEIAREETGHIPEVSYGTRFFQDLVEANIMYLPVYPGDPDTAFNAAFFDSSPNIIGELLPETAGFDGVVQLIDVPAVTGGQYAQIIAELQNQRAICFTGPE